MIKANNNKYNAPKLAPPKRSSVVQRHPAALSVQQQRTAFFAHRFCPSHLTTHQVSLV